MESILDRLASWFELEPLLSFLMALAAIALFIGAYRKAVREGSRFWEWLKGTLEAAGTTLLFLGLLWVARGILNDNYASFIASHGRVSEANYSSVQNIWGGSQAQRDLSVSHSIEREVMEELPREDETKPPLYKKVLRRIPVEQNSIARTRIQAELRSNTRQKGSALYNGFVTKFSAEYLVRNDSDLLTDAAFSFPLPYNQSMFEGIVVLVDGREVSKELRVSSEEIYWTMPMKPGEEWAVSIRYATRGMEHFYFQMPEPRQIKDFVFTLALADLPAGDINYPEGCIPPTELIRATEDGKGSVLEWRLDNTISTAGMGVALPKPEQPGARTARMLAASPYALMMLLLALGLSLILAGKGVRLLDLSLLAGAYCVMHLLAASLSDSFLGFWGSLLIGAAASCALSYFLSRGYGPALRRSAIALTAFFSAVYPLLSQLDAERASLEPLVAAGLIVYLFAMALWSKREVPAGSIAG
jgi:hypothetical protein